MTSSVDIDDVQALVFSGHAKLPHAMAAWLAVHDAARARETLRALVEDSVAFGIGDRHVPAVQVLLSAAGLRALGATEEQLAALDRPFLQGITTEQRRRALGDGGRNDPAEWAWSDGETHALVLAYGGPDVAEAVCDPLLRRLAPGWSPLGACLPARLPVGSREPFGFRDGLTRTRVDVGDGARAPGLDLLPPGEVLLGHRTAAGTIGTPPLLGRNGSYVVVRQLAQDVRGFWAYWRAQGASDEEAVWLAAKAVGRWPNGMPVDGGGPRPEPRVDEAVVSAPLSFADDPRGERCPLGAHVRRASPRDGLAIGTERSLAATAARRLLRRGRVYGTPAPAAWLPTVACGEEERAAADDGGERGLLFVALCADLARQFEFVQQTWLNDPKHADLFDEVDPISAGDAIEGEQQRFTIPRAGLRRRLCGVTRWVTVRGGGYFLLPSKSALRALLA